MSVLIKFEILRSRTPLQLGRRDSHARACNRIGENTDARKRNEQLHEDPVALMPSEQHPSILFLPSEAQFVSGYSCPAWIMTPLSFQYSRNPAVSWPDGLAPAACSSIEFPK